MRLTGWTALLALAALPARADLSLQLFGDVGADVRRASGETRAAFDSNHLDVFATASHDRFSLLSEVVFEVAENNEFAADVERLQATYLVADWLRVSAGRFHTAIGYYNDTFHHGSVFQLPVERPLPVRFEDAGGFIPAHFVGVHVDGRIPIGGQFRLRYDLEAANTRAPARDAVVNAFDALSTKAMNGRLRLETSFGAATLVVGGNALVDRVPLTADHPALDERILGVHAAYFGPRLSVIAELYDVRHSFATGTAGGATQDVAVSTRAGFAEVGFRVLDEITPYAVFEFVHYPAGGDPYFAGEQSHVTATAGARWLVAEAMALKAQASRTAGDATETRFSAQFAFGF